MKKSSIFTEDNTGKLIIFEIDDILPANESVNHFRRLFHPCIMQRTHYNFDCDRLHILEIWGHYEFSDLVYHRQRI